MPIRLLTVADAATVAAFVRATRRMMEPFDPVRDESFYTERGQVDLLIHLASESDAGRSFPYGIFDDGGEELVGRVTVNNVVRGAFQSASIGYQVRPDQHGRGVATSAVAEIVNLAFGDLNLHRLEAATLVDNRASQRVLVKNGFEQYATSPQYLHIAGRWRDHALFQRVDPDWTDRS